jgi:translation initiation factor 2 beta subunit (eIF-2beta)/eIF-5
MTTTLRHWLCVLCGGHDRLLNYEKDRIFLKCTNCGHETPGWSIEPK